MKRSILLGLLLICAIVTYAQSTMSNLYKQWMIEDINNHNFERAYSEISHISDWSFDENNASYIDVELGLKFADYIDSITTLPSQVLDSFVVYVGRVCYSYSWQYYNQGDYQSAIQYCYLACNIIREIFGDKHVDYAMYLNDLGLLCYDAGDFVSAEQNFLQALELRQEVYGVNHPMYAQTLNNLGLVYENTCNYTKAEQLFRTALGIYKDAYGENHPDYTTTLNNLGLNYFEQGDFANAEKYFIKTLELNTKLLGEEHVDVARTLNNLGLLCERQGDYIKAEEYLLKSLKVYRSIYGENHPAYAKPLHNLGIIYYDKKEYHTAIECYLKSLQILESAIGTNNSSYVAVLICLANSYVAIKEYALAEDAQLKALSIQNATIGKEHPNYVSTLSNLGVLYQIIGDNVKAEQYLLEGINISKLLYGEEHREYGKQLYNLGALYYECGNYHKAEPYMLASNTMYKQQYITSLSYMSEEQREALWMSIYPKFLLLYPQFAYKYYNQKNNISEFAYNNELFLKGLSTYSSRSLQHAVLESGDTLLINQWQAFNREKEMIITLKEQGANPNLISEHQEHANALEKSIVIQSTEYRNDQQRFSITWDSVRNHLKEGQTAIEFVPIYFNRDSVIYCALLLQFNSQYPLMVPLFKEKDVFPLCFPYVHGKYKPNYAYSWDMYGLELTKHIWGNIIPYIKPGDTIFFAPAGILHQVAIESLPYNTEYTMSDVFNIKRLSSTTEIVLKKPQSEFTTATIYGGIQYDLDIDNLLAESERYAQEDLLASRSIENDTINRGNVQYLPGTKKEAENINTLLENNNISAMLYTSSKANEESFKSLNGKYCTIIHLATHGFYWSTSIANNQELFSKLLMKESNRFEVINNPMNRCGLLFAGANTALQGNRKYIPEGVQDGILTAAEIALMDFRGVSLVVLSACETGMGDMNIDGLSGLQTAFKMAGVQTIIMSLWKVNDQATQLLMTEFYNNWIGKHQSKREAFRNAQNTVRTQYEEPEYWAGFIMLD